MSVRVLEIGNHPEYAVAKPEKMFPDLDIIVATLDVNPDYNPDILHDIREPLPPELHGAFDIVVCSHVLEHVEWRRAIPTLFYIQQALAYGGELHLLVPSLEYACQMVLMGQHTVNINGALYGGQTDEQDYHKSGYTLDALRQLVEILGMVCRKAIQSKFRAIFENQEEYVLQNYVIALKMQEPEAIEDDAGDAIELLDSRKTEELREGML